MPRQLITIITLVSLLTLFPNAFARVGLSTSSPETSAPDKSRNSSCPTCQAAPQNDPLSRLDRLSTLGRRTQASPFLPLKRSIFDGLPVNFVNTSRGNLAFGAADIYLPGGPTPIAFQRSYVSDRREDIGLGVGWSFGFTDKISVDGDVAKLSDVSGTLEFRRDPQSQRFVSQPAEPGLHQQFEITDPTTITERASDVTRVYTKIGDAYQLSRITGPRGINVLVSHDAAGRLTRVANDPGAWIAFEWAEGRDARLLAVVDSSGRRVSFRQDGRLLRTVVDQSGAEWTYDYTNKGLRQAIDPIGRVLLRARYDKFGRVTAAGDAFGFTRYDYESRRTIVTDPLGAVSVYEQTDLGAIATVTDDEGRRVSIQYSEKNRLARLSDSIGNEMTFSHDSENGLLSQSTNGSVDRAVVLGANGRPSSFLEGTERTDLSLDERGQIISAQSSNPANSYSATYDSRGQIVNLKSAGREVSFEYDANGNETAINHSEVGRFTYARDTAGRVLAANFPSGLSYFNEYDARGAFIKQSDNRGNAVTVERDASGLPIAYIRADGRQRRAVRDEGGRVIRDTNYDGSVRSFTYNVRGALIDYRSPGNHRKFEYDHRGRLTGMIDDNGSVNRVERDGAGRIRRLSYSTSVAQLEKPLRLLRLAHASALQEILPPPDCCGEDVIYTDVWAHYYELIGGGGGGGGQHPPLQSEGGAGGTGGTYDPLECAGYLTGCFMGIMLYPHFVAALMAACEVTFGLGCFSALVVMVGEPLMAIIACAQAYNKCGLH